MLQKTYTTNDIEAHGRILLIPVALTIPVIMGSIGKIEFFQRDMLFYVTMLALVTGLAIWFFLFESSTEQKALVLEEDRVSFHDFGRHTVFWSEIEGIDIQKVDSPKMKGGKPVQVERVVIRAKRSSLPGTPQGDPERYALQYNYGMSLHQLCTTLREGWEAGRHHRVSIRKKPVGEDHDFRMPASTHAAPATFGRRRSDMRR